jgi:hypothetical protein
MLIGRQLELHESMAPFAALVVRFQLNLGDLTNECEILRLNMLLFKHCLHYLSCDIPNHPISPTGVWVWVILRPTVSRPVCLGIKPLSGAYDQIFITVRPLRVFDMGRPLWREDGSVFYNVQNTIHFTVSDLRLPQPGGPGPCIYIPQEQGGLVIPPGTGFDHTLLQLERFTSRIYG